MARPTLDKKGTEFKMRMSDTEKAKLKELADLNNRKMSEYVMYLIDREYKRLEKYREEIKREE